MKIKKKIYSGLQDWQPVWEQVQYRGLLIEYTYLLTRGQMIKDRIAQQLKGLNQQLDAAAKMEILRIVSVADCLNLKVETSVLIAYIDKSIKFTQDRGATLQELESEYFIRFDQQYIEGLHPVRSEHLKDALHVFVPVRDTLMTVFKLLRSEKYDFFVNAPGMLDDSEKPAFYKDLAEILAGSPFTDMVAAFDGILHGEPQDYWLKNKSFFDQASALGAIEFFVYDSTPFVNLKTLQQFGETLGEEDGRNFRTLDELAKNLSGYSLKNSGVFLFGSALSLVLPLRSTTVDSYEGLEFLHKWFKKLNLPFSLQIDTSQERLIQQLKTLPISESKDLFVYSRIHDPNAYEEFTRNNRSEIISLLKVKTDSITIQEDGGEIFIQYLIRDDEIDRANDLSVDRARIISSFLPFYEKYNIRAILLPFPSEQLISAVLSSSNKTMTLDAIGDLFNVRLNVIWSSTILKNYAASSVFEWQKGILDIRNQAIETVKSFVRFLDALIERNRTKQLASIKPMIWQREKLSAMLSAKKEFPSYKTKQFDIEIYAAEQKIISGLLMSLSNLNNQFQNIVNPLNENDRNIGTINLKAVYFDFEKMQSAFSKIEALTFQYQDNTALLNSEVDWYSRLYKTLMYFFDHEPIELQHPKAVAKNAVFEWWERSHNYKLNTLKRMLTEIALDNGLKFYMPTAFTETETLTFASFGIADFDHTGYDLLKLSLALKPIHVLDIHFYSIYFVTDSEVKSGIRFSKEYLDVDTADPDLDIDMPIPIVPDEESLLSLPDLKLSKPLTNDVRSIYFAAIYNLWRLTECRTRLNRSSQTELSWLVSLEEKYITLVLDSMEAIHENDIDIAFRQWSLDIIEEKEMPDQEDFVEKLFEMISL